MTVAPLCATAWPTRLLEAAAMLVEYVPAIQPAHVKALVAPLAEDHVPGSQVMHVDAPEFDHEPALHVPHVAALEAPTAAENAPATQFKQVRL